MNKRFLRKGVLAFAFFMISATLLAQGDYDHWIKAVNWDGVTPWENYIRRSPRFMGPNALPVPLSRYPRLGQQLQFESAVEMHRAPGDRTDNLFHQITIPMASDRVELSLQYRSIEWYSTSPEVRDNRRARDASGAGTSEGDVWIITAFQLVRQDKSPRWPDLVLQISTKTTAGKNFENARHTNSPGYIFDLHAGRRFERPGQWLSAWSLFGQAGLYVWQDEINGQNDAFNYALNLELKHGKWALTPAIAGYTGWRDNGDRPMVSRLQFSHQNKHFRFYGAYQYAHRDLTRHLFRLGVGYQFRWSKWPH